MIPCTVMSTLLTFRTQEMPKENLSFDLQRITPSLTYRLSHAGAHPCEYTCVRGVRVHVHVRVYRKKEMKGSDPLMRVASHSRRRKRK